MIMIVNYANSHDYETYENKPLFFYTEFQTIEFFHNMLVYIFKRKKNTLLIIKYLYN